MSSYGERRWGKPPPGYVPGLGRGAVGFVTRLDIGPARNIIFNQYVNFSFLYNFIFIDQPINQNQLQTNKKYKIFIDMKINYLIKKRKKMRKILKQINNMKILINIWKSEEKI